MQLARKSIVLICIIYAGAESQTLLMQIWHLKNVRQKTFNGKQFQRYKALEAFYGKRMGTLSKKKQQP